MSDYRPIHDLQESLAPLKQGFKGKKVQHHKSADWYVITGFHFKEDDMTMWFSYETLHREPVSFLRPIVELFDGRFKH